MIEIERKFLVTSDIYKTEAYKKTEIIQGFLNSNKHRTVRVRLRDGDGYLTIKGISDAEGLSRFEWEKQIPQAEAKALLELCEPGRIDKIRYEVKIGAHIFEVDEFFGDNNGLVVAEVELTTKDETFEKPSWLGEDVTGQLKYYNSQLSLNPFNKW